MSESGQTTSNDPHSVAVTWWFNVDTHQVERGHEGAPNARRLGPYASQGDAELALERARARSKEWDDEDAEDEG